MINRRTFLSGTACLCCAMPSPVQSASSRGCIRYFTEPADPNGGLSGLGRIDPGDPFANGLVMILADLRDLFGVAPSFAFYDDDASNPNALASLSALAPAILGPSS